MPEPTYRQASQDDAEAIAAVSAHVWREEGESSGIREPPDHRRGGSRSHGRLRRSRRHLHLRTR